MQEELGENQIWGLQWFKGPFLPTIRKLGKPTSSVHIFLFRKHLLLLLGRGLYGHGVLRAQHSAPSGTVGEHVTERLQRGSA